VSQAADDLREDLVDRKGSHECTHSEGAAMTRSWMAGIKVEDAAIVYRERLRGVGSPETERDSVVPVILND
jgi:hypothetical protein